MTKALNLRDYRTIVQAPAPLAADTEYRHDPRRCGECQRFRASIRWEWWELVQGLGVVLAMACLGVALWLYGSRAL